MKPCSDRTAWPLFAVFDIEATEWVNVVVLCHMDEHPGKLKSEEFRAKVFYNVTDYIDWCFSDANQAGLIWAHWGGHYDHRFIIELCYQREWTMDMNMSSSLIIICKVTDKKGRTITFCESARLMPDSVEKIGESIGLPKLDADRTNLQGDCKGCGGSHKACFKATKDKNMAQCCVNCTHLSMDEIISYCFRDCEIVLKGLISMRKILKAQGLDFAFTLASMATRYIRRSDVLQWHKFYEPDPDKPGEMRYSERILDADRFCLPAYFGGRCEVFRVGHFKGPLYYYDISSSYPWAMTQPLPAYFKGYHTPGKNITEALKLCGITMATVTIPENTYLPLLAIREHGKLIFRTGTFTGTWTNLELAECWEQIKRKKGASMVLHKMALYESRPFMRPFVEQFWKLRKEAIEEKDEYRKYAYKIVLNAPSGKLAESSDKTGVVYGDAVEDALRTHGEKCLKLTSVPGVYITTFTQEGSFRHIAAAAYITAMGRLKLAEGMRRCLKQKANLLYCDTDSIITDKPIFGFPKGKELGEWHLEHIIESAEIYCPKVYKLITKEGKIIYAAKGMPIARREDKTQPEVAAKRWEAFTANVNRLVEVIPPKPIKEGIEGLLTALSKRDRLTGMGSLKPKAFELKRQLLQIDTKRQHLPNGDSKPYGNEHANYEYKRRIPG